MYVRVETEGLVLSVRPYKERDLLVRLLSECCGKLTLLVKRGASEKYRYKTAVSLLGGAQYDLSVNEEGLSFISTVKEEFSFRHIQQSMTAYAYALLILELADAVTEEHQANPLLYGYIKQALTYIDEGKEASIIAAIMAVQLLPLFGIQLTLDHCLLCGERRWTLPYDYSSAVGGTICERHFLTEIQRWHLSPRAVFYLRKFQQINFYALENIHVNQENQQAIWRALDQIYYDYLGLSFPSRNYLKKMAQAEQKVSQFWMQQKKD